MWRWKTVGNGSTRPTARRRTIGLAGAATALLVLAGCGAPQSAEPTPAPTEIVVGVVGELTSFNPGTVHGATPANLAVADFTHETFAYLDDQLQIVGNGGFGEVERISADPLRVQYTVFDDRAWSDGTPVTVDDLLFGWAARSGWFDDAAYAEDGSIVSGTRYFDAAGSGERLDTRRPLIDRTEQTITLTYTEPFADWNREWLLDRPAHVVAERAGVSMDQLVQAIRTTPRGDPLSPREPDPVLLAAAEVWNTGFDVGETPDLATAVSNGPYVAVEARDDALVLGRNEHYTGNHDPAFDRLELRFFPDGESQRAAVAAGDVDVANLGDATAAELRRLRESEVEVLTGARPEVLALVFIDDGERLDPDVREALTLTIDRERLVDESVGAVAQDAVPAQSFLATAATGEQYERLVDGNGAPATGADVSTAVELLDGRDAVLRIRYEPTDVLAADLFAEIAGMAARADISVRPAGDDDAADAELMSLDVGGTLYEVASARAAADAGGAKALAAVAQMRQHSDPEEVLELAREVDRALFDDGYGIPLVARTGAVAASVGVEGVGYTAAHSSAPRYFWTWRSAAD